MSHKPAKPERDWSVRIFVATLAILVVLTLLYVFVLAQGYNGLMSTRT